MEVEIERAEIMAALDADRALGQGSYIGMFLSIQRSSKTDRHLQTVSVTRRRRTDSGRGPVSCYKE
jgi:hypothetical protein